MAGKVKIAQCQCGAEFLQGVAKFCSLCGSKLPDEQPEASDNCEAAKIEEARWHLEQARKISSDSSLLIDNLHDLMFHFVRAEKGLGLKGVELKKAADEILVPFYARSVCETKSSPGSYFFQYNASPLEPILLFYSIRELDLEYLRHYASLHLFNVIKDLWKDVEAFFQRSSYRCKESDYNYLHTMVTEFTKLIERSFAGGQNLATAAEDTERYSFLAHINQVFLQQKVWRINDNGEYVNIDVLSAEDKKSFIDKADEYLMKTAESRKNIAQDKPIATASGKTEEPIDNDDDDDEDDDDSYDEDLEEALAQIFAGTGLKATIVDADDDDDEDDEDEDDEDEDNEDEDNEDEDNEDEDNEDAAEENSAAETDKASYPFPGASATDVNNILPGFSFIGGTVVSASDVQRRTENQANAEGKSSAQPAAGGNSSVAQVNDREKRVSPKIEVVHPKSSRKEPAARAVKNVPAWAVPAKNIKHPPGSRTAPVPVAIENKPAKPPSFENSAGCATAIISMIVLVAAVSGSGGNENGTNVLIFMFFVFAAASALCFYIGSRKK